MFKKIELYLIDCLEQKNGIPQGYPVSDFGVRSTSYAIHTRIQRDCSPLGRRVVSCQKKLEGPNAAIVLDQFAYYADAVVTVRQLTVPVLAQDYTCTEYMEWLVASRNYSAYVEVAKARLQHLEAMK
jgi:hypothetical protein